MMKKLSNYAKAVLFILIAIILIVFVVKLSSIKLSESKDNINNIIVLEKLRAAAKLVIWEQDFVINNVTEKEKKYFNLDFLTFQEKVITSARGRIGFHIDLADTVNTKIVVKNDLIEIYASLELTYVSIDNSTINQIREASIDPTIKIDKEEIIKNLNELALREHLKPAILQAKAASLSEQEENLERITGRKVKIYITQYPTIDGALKKILNKG
ncbi:MAG: hypothetical protein ACOXZ9_06935 [Bacteroidales bacterium]|jgi:hypothetical protein